MTTEAFQHRLNCLGWKVIDEWRQSDRWYLFAKSCGHTIVTIADSRFEAWLAACSMAMKLTREEIRHPSIRS